MGMSAPLFQPFRALGYITDSVPYSVQRLGRESFVTVSVGKSWQVGFVCSARHRFIIYSVGGVLTRFTSHQAGSN